MPAIELLYLCTMRGIQKDSETCTQGDNGKKKKKSTGEKEKGLRRNVKVMSGLQTHEQISESHPGYLPISPVSFQIHVFVQAFMS